MRENQVEVINLRKPIDGESATGLARLPVKYRNTYTSLPARFLTPGKCTTHLPLGLASPAAKIWVVYCPF